MKNSKITTTLVRVHTHTHTGYSNENKINVKISTLIKNVVLLKCENKYEINSTKKRRMFYAF